MISLVDILLCLIVLFLLASIYWYLTIPKNLPPGPLGLPFIGSALSYFDGTKQHLHLVEQVKKYGPISKLYIGNKLVIVLGNYEAIHEGFVKQGDVFTGRPKTEDPFVPEKLRGLGLITSEGEMWKEHRRFAFSTLRDFGVGSQVLEPLIKEEMEYFCERIREYSVTGEELNPHHLLTLAVSNVISQFIFGHRFSYDDEEFVKQFDGLASISSGTGDNFLSPFILNPEIASIATLLPQSSQSMKETCNFADYTESQVRTTMSTFDPDSNPTNYVHAFLKAASTIEGKSYFTENHLFSNCLDMFQAGTETVAAVILWAILHLAHKPEVQERLYEEIKHEIGTNALPTYADRVKLPYAEAVILESLRIANLAPMSLYRKAVVPTKLMGYHIPKDSIVVPLLHNILHNPDLYPQPFSFKPERFLDADGKVIKDQRLIAFGIGKRFCLGEQLARIELFMVLIGLASRFRFYFPSGKPRPTVNPVISFVCSPVPYQVCVESRD